MAPSILALNVKIEIPRYLLYREGHVLVQVTVLCFSVPKKTFLSVGTPSTVLFRPGYRDKKKKNKSSCQPLQNKPKQNARGVRGNNAQTAGDAQLAVSTRAMRSRLKALPLQHCSLQHMFQETDVSSCKCTVFHIFKDKTVIHKS